MNILIERFPKQVLHWDLPLPEQFYKNKMYRIHHFTVKQRNILIEQFPKQVLHWDLPLPEHILQKQNVSNSPFHSQTNEHFDRTMS